MLVWIVFTVAPILFGLDKFANVLADDWTRYLAPEFNDIIPGSASDAMHIVGVVEIVAGLVVAVTPRFGGLLVAAGERKRPIALARHLERLRPWNSETAPARREKTGAVCFTGLWLEASPVVSPAPGGARCAGMSSGVRVTRRRS